MDGLSQVSVGGVAVAGRAVSISLKSAGHGRKRSDGYGKKLGIFQESPRSRQAGQSQERGIKVLG